MLDRNAANDIRRALKNNQRIWDPYFDRLYPVPVRDISARFWTPVRVARHAAAWLTAGGAKRVLDIGAGVGKFCIIGAMTTEAEFVGIERRPRLVAIANRAIQALEITTASVTVGDFDSLLWEEYDAFYFYNPFEENKNHVASYRIDNAVELSAQRFEEDTTKARQLLGRAPVGTRVATYHGFGGDMPVHYVQVNGRPRIKDLSLWIKQDTPHGA